MDKLTLKLNYICAFCTKITDSKAAGVLQTFNCEFISNPLFQLNCGVSANSNTSKCENILGDNWSICENCLPQLQLLLESKQKVDKVDSEVIYLQRRLLTEIKCLSKEVDKMCGDMVMIEGILRGNPIIPTITKTISFKKRKRGRPSSKLTDENNIMVQFRQKIFNVLQHLQIFRVDMSNKLLLKSLPPKSPVKSSSSSSTKPDQLPVAHFKIEIDEDSDNLAEIELDTENNYLISPPTSPPPSSSSPPPPPMLPLATETDQEEGRPCTRVRKSVPPRKSTDFEGLDLTSSSDEEVPDHDIDFEFDPRQRISVKLGKKISTFSKFRKTLISRIREHSTIATSACLPLSKSDPRRPYTINYNAPLNQFSINDILINCLDSSETLQCSKCDYSINSKNSKGSRIEDSIFDHVLSKHLNAFICKSCGNNLPSWVKYSEHLRIHAHEFTCNICERTLTSNKGLKDHKWTHLSEEEKKMAEYSSWMPSGVKNGDLKFICETCGKGFKKGARLREHEVIHMDKGEREKVMCADCGKQVFLRSLKAHQRKWCDKVMDWRRRWDCTVCGERLKSLRRLHEHLGERHPGEKVWACGECGGRFKKKGQLRKHEEVHGEGFKFICEGCGRGFKQKTNRRRHEATCQGRGGKGD